MNVKNMMGTLRKDQNFMSFMPNLFLKKEPPRLYFWGVYSTLFREEFDKLYDANMDRIRRKIRKPTELLVTSEQKEILLSRKDDSLRLLLELKRPGISKNITYLRKTARRQQDSGTVDVSRQHPVLERTRTSFGKPRLNETGA